MDNNEKTKMVDIVKLIKPYTALYPSCKLDAPGLVLYSKALVQLPLQVIEMAMAKLLQTNSFFPTVAEVYKAAEDIESHIKREATGEYTPTAAEAWEEIQQHVKQIGTYGKWPYSHDEVKRAAEQFGVYELCVLPADGVNTARAQFMRIYDGILQRSKEECRNKRALAALGPQHAAMLIAAVAGTKQIK